VLQQGSTRRSLLLSKKLHSLLKTLKIHETRPLDYGRKQQINFLSFWEQWCFLRSKCKGAFWFYPTNWCEGLHKAVILRLMGSSTTRKSSNEHGFFVVVTFLNKIGEGGSETFLVTSSFSWPSNAPCSLWSGRIRDITCASYPIMSWCVSTTAPIFLALRQKFWLPECSPI